MPPLWSATEDDATAEFAGLTGEAPNSTPPPPHHH